MAKDKKHELVIIGAGPGGYRAAFMAADLGLNVTLIDPEANPGGVCLYRGCIPTKALLHLAEIRKDAEEAEDMGMKFTPPEIDIKKVIEWKDKVVKKLTGGLGQLNKARKINYIRGMAKFISENEVEVEKDEGGKEKIQFENAIISTGAKPVSLPGIDISKERILDSEKALELKTIPKKLLVIGGGYIGLEMATIYKAMGSKVSVAELTPDFMPGSDSDLIAEYKKMSKGTFDNVWLETKVEEIQHKKNNCHVKLKPKEGDSFEEDFDYVLVAVGQKPNSESAGLENASVETTEKGFIKINEKQQTSTPHIYAIGDVAGPPMLAHKASYEGRVAAEVIAGKKAVNDARAIPAVVYTNPEIATCGITEQQAKEKGIPYKALKFPWGASGRAAAMNENKGFTKLLVNTETERILGAGIVGKHAGSLIPELVLAIEMGATAEDLALSIHPHPTLSETIMEAAEVLYGHPTHIYSKKK